MLKSKRCLYVENISWSFFNGDDYILLSRYGNFCTSFYLSFEVFAPNWTTQNDPRGNAAVESHKRTRTQNEWPEEISTKDNCNCFKTTLACGTHHTNYSKLFSISLLFVDKVIWDKKNRRNLYKFKWRLAKSSQISRSLWTC